MRKGTTRRSYRLGDQIMRELAEIVVKDIRDPRLEFLNITGVRMNSDLNVAEVMYTHINGHTPDLDQALHGASGFLRSELGRRLKLKYVPALRFVWDEFLEKMVYD
ncbi:MAG: 30S ribosome-binding factor RbfA [Desulfonatronovibrionaceae bacterium]